MNKLQIGFPIGIGIIITIIVILMLQNSAQKNIEIDSTEEISMDENMLKEIQKKYEQLENENENEIIYKSKEREWITSGPFQIDRSEYRIGEKIFLRINELQYGEKGEAVFLRPLNDTHTKKYLSISFDGMKGGFNYYLQPQLSKIKGICSVDDIIGEWTVVFTGTQYKNLKFKINEEIIPGDEKYYKTPEC